MQPFEYSGFGWRPSPINFLSTKTCCCCLSSTMHGSVNVKLISGTINMLLTPGSELLIDTRYRISKLLACLPLWTALLWRLLINESFIINDLKWSSLELVHFVIILSIPFRYCTWMGEWVCGEFLPWRQWLNAFIWVTVHPWIKSHIYTNLIW